MASDCTEIIPRSALEDRSDPPCPPRRPVFAKTPTSIGGRQGLGTCQWIEGEPRGGETIYCDAPALPRRPWCRAHHRRASLPTASDEARRAIARFNLIAKNRQIGRDAVYYVDRDFDRSPADFKLLAGASRARPRAAP